MTTPSHWARAATAHVAARSVGMPLDRALRVTLNFHPDRVTGGRTVLEHLLADGRYRTQFETGTGNGGLTAHEGGDRWRWEQRIFGHAYDAAPPSERPCYGALDHRPQALGGAPRFGSAYLRLTEAALDRCSFCFPDSFLEPEDFGTAALFDLVRHAHDWDARPVTDLIEQTEGGWLDNYIEAHVHGGVDLSRDVEALVLDPCFAGTEVEEQARCLTDALPLDLLWHEGRRLAVTELQRHRDFRGADIVTVGRRISRDGWLDARIVGQAVAAGVEDPQDLKRVWHHVARFGAPHV